MQCIKKLKINIRQPKFTSNNLESSDINNLIILRAGKNSSSLSLEGLLTKSSNPS